MTALFVVAVLVGLAAGWAALGRAFLRAYRLTSEVSDKEVRALCAGRSRAHGFRSSVPFFVVSIEPGEATLMVCGTFNTESIPLDPAQVELTWVGERLTRIQVPRSGTVLYVRAWRPGRESGFLPTGSTRVPVDRS